MAWGEASSFLRDAEILAEILAWIGSLDLENRAGADCRRIRRRGFPLTQAIDHDGVTRTSAVLITGDLKSSGMKNGRRGFLAGISRRVLL